MNLGILKEAKKIFLKISFLSTTKPGFNTIVFYQFEEAMIVKTHYYFVYLETMTQCPNLTVLWKA